MAVFATGDTHGAQQIGWHSVDGFMHRFNTDSFPEQRDLGKEDFVVILGDFGGVFTADRHSAQEPGDERNALNWLEQKPFTTLFVPGNHENYDRLMGCRDERLLTSWFYAAMPEAEKEKLSQGYPREMWHGGAVRVLRPSVLMLERGYIFEIDGRSCFAFGGARSHDIEDGILDPADYPDERSYKRAIQASSMKMVRIKGVSWWAEEMPSVEEMEKGMANIHSWLERHEQIDFIFTHEAPDADRALLGWSGSDELSAYLERIRASVPYGHWLFKHLHDNRQVTDRDLLLYEQIIRIS